MWRGNGNGGASDLVIQSRVSATHTKSIINAYFLKFMLDRNLGNHLFGYKFKKKVIVNFRSIIVPILVSFLGEPTYPIIC